MKKTSFTLKVRCLLVTAMLLLSVTSMYAQTTIKGVVTDATDGSPLIGASVKIKGTTTGAVTDIDGNFSVKISSPADVLVCAYVGYESQEVAVGTQTAISFSLSPEIMKLAEVVVVGYGSQKKDDLTGAVAVVAAEDLTKSGASSFDKALQGRAAGVVVSQTSGRPGAGVSVKIRGVGSINANSEPLYVVDGVMMGNGGKDDDAINPMSMINPNDIESMQILKDASSCAIYGSRGANGVIIITTKRGQSGTPKVNFSTSHGISYLPERTKLNMMNSEEYIKFMERSYQNLSAIDPKRGLLPAYSTNYQNYGKNNTDWQDLIQQKAYSHNYNISISGGNEKSNFMVSSNYTKEDGVLITTGLERYTFKANSDFQIKDWLKVGENITYSRVSVRNQGDQNGSPWIISLQSSPLMFNKTSDFQKAEHMYYTQMGISAHDIDSIQTNYLINNKDGYEGPGNYITGANDITNPVAELILNEKRNTSSNFIFSTYQDVSFFKQLTFKNTATVKYNNFYDYTWRNQYIIGGLGRDNPVNSLSETGGNGITLQFEQQLTYADKIDDHNFSATVVHTSEHGNGRSFTGSGNDFFFSTLRVLSNAKEGLGRTSSGSAYHFAWESYLGRINYDYKGKYLFTSNYRRDGSYKFAHGRQWSDFFSASGGWKINEDFLKDVKEINMLKLRVGWGQTGNANISDYTFASQLTVNNQAHYGIGGIDNVGYMPFYSFGNANIQWETTEMTNIGIDLAAFNNKIEFTFEYFNKNQDKMLVRKPVSMINGSSSDGGEPWANIGKVKNDGFELSMRYRKKEGAFHYSLGGNISLVSNKVVSVPSDRVYSDANVVFQGHPIGALYGWVAEGIFQSQEEIDKHAKQEAGTAPGDFKFKDINHDGVINAQDRVIIGNPIPKYSYGINFDCDYKGIDFSIFFQGVYDVDVINNVRKFNELGTGDPNQKDYNRLKETYTKGWTPENHSNTHTRALTFDPNANNRTSTWFLEDASYIRLKSIQLGYNLPQTLVNKISLSNMRVYISGNNLMVFTKYKGRDPEVSTISPTSAGVDNGSYPVPASVTMGVTVDF